MDQQTVQNDLRKQMPGGTFDLLPAAEQAALMRTRAKELTAGSAVAPAPPANEPAIVHRLRRPALILADASAPEAELRASLRTAIAGHQLADAALAEARRLDGRAAERLAAAQTDLARFDGLSEAIASHELAALRSESEDDDLPFDLQQALRDKSVAADRCERAAIAQRQIATEVDAAEERATAGRLAVDHAVASVAVSLARQLVEGLDAVERDATAIRRRIAALQLGGLNLPADLARAPYRAPEPLKPDPAAKASWAALLSRLHSDPDAFLE